MNVSRETFDVVVIGGGHAGVEAAYAAARMGARVALLTLDPARVGAMPCNPAVGGPGKSQLVHEVHALGGLIGRAADRAAIHTRVLNRSKGPAVWSERVQTDRDLYALAVQELLFAHPNVVPVRGEAVDFWIENGAFAGVRTADGRLLRARAGVLAAGTFLRGKVWYGMQARPAGRQGEPPARWLSNALERIGHRLMRFKTGTPPRIRADTIDYQALTEVPPDDPPATFSGEPGPHATALATWMTRTTDETHRLIRDHLGFSPLYAGKIEAVGPRYCPSIEDKVVRFADKESHLLFVEPDGLYTSEVYLQGFSSSLPPAVQERMVRSLPGFARAEIQRYAYAVEYDAVDPTEVTWGLASRKLLGLFLAGQVLGTSGYEEAAALGLLAGVNAARHAGGKEAVTLSRSSSYLGVMVDDLVGKGVDEPYRMMTSRVELRLLVRGDNADERLVPLGVAWGLLPEAEERRVREKYARVARELERLSRVKVEGVSALHYLRRPEATYPEVLHRVGPPEETLSPEEMRQVEIRAKYAGYIERQERLRKRLEELAGHPIPEGVDFPRVPSLSREAAERLAKARPKTLAEAARLPGVRDSDVTALLVYLTRIGRKAG